MKLDSQNIIVYVLSFHYVFPLKRLISFEIKDTKYNFSHSSIS